MTERSTEIIFTISIRGKLAGKPWEIEHRATGYRVLADDWKQLHEKLDELHRTTAAQPD